VDELKAKITWKHLDNLDASLKNDKLKEDSFQQHLQLSYHHKKILVSDKLAYIFPKG
jgi:hypothetical protein